MKMRGSAVRLLNTYISKYWKPRGPFWDRTICIFEKPNREYTGHSDDKLEYSVSIPVIRDRTNATHADRLSLRRATSKPSCPSLTLAFCAAVISVFWLIGGRDEKGMRVSLNLLKFVHALSIIISQLDQRNRLFAYFGFGVLHGPLTPCTPAG